MAGIATGSHLHFEVRLGENSYKASRNPELWLAPHTGPTVSRWARIAGRFLDTYGDSLEMPASFCSTCRMVRTAPAISRSALMTYEEKGLVGQPPFLESFGLGDLPAGLYRISFPMGGLRQELVQVLPGQLTVVTFEAQPGTNSRDSDDRSDKMSIVIRIMSSYACSGHTYQS